MKWFVTEHGQPVYVITITSGAPYLFLLRRAAGHGKFEDVLALLTFIFP